jgi:hypothetical protein
LWRERLLFLLCFCGEVVLAVFWWRQEKPTDQKVGDRRRIYADLDTHTRVLDAEPVPHRDSGNVPLLESISTGIDYRVGRGGPCGLARM